MAGSSSRLSKRASRATARASSISRVYAFGLRNTNALVHGDTEWEFSEEILRVIVEQDGNGADDCTRLRVGTTARRPFGTRRRPGAPMCCSMAWSTATPTRPGGPQKAKATTAVAHRSKSASRSARPKPMRIWRIPLAARRSRLPIRRGALGLSTRAGRPVLAFSRISPARAGRPGCDGPHRVHRRGAACAQ
jgi:hypothetical protein